MDLISKIERKLRQVEDFPKKGIVFQDITPLLSDPTLYEQIVGAMAKQVEAMGAEALACIESRGFFFGPAIAQKLGIPWAPIRKKGKLPYKTVSEEYALEYGTDIIEMHEDAFQAGAKVVIHDDVLATGGTGVAAAKLVGSVTELAGFSFLMDLTFLEGRKKLVEFTPNVEALLKIK